MFSTERVPLYSASRASPIRCEAAPRHYSFLAAVSPPGAVPARTHRELRPESSFLHWVGLGYFAVATWLAHGASEGSGRTSHVIIKATSSATAISI